MNTYGKEVISNFCPHPKVSSNKTVTDRIPPTNHLYATYLRFFMTKQSDKSTKKKKKTNVSTKCLLSNRKHNYRIKKDIVKSIIGYIVF